MIIRDVYLVERVAIGANYCSDLANMKLGR